MNFLPSAPRSDQEQERHRWYHFVTQILQGKLPHGLVWDDCYPSSVTVGTAGANVPAFTAYNGNLKAFEFLGVTNMKEINMGFQLYHSRKDNTNIIPHVHLYVPSDGSGGNIRFGCEYTWANVNSTGVLATTTVYGDLTAAAGTVYNNQILSFGEISGADKGLSSIFMCRFFRTPTATEDTFGSSVWLKSADCHIQKTWWGSVFQYARR